MTDQSQLSGLEFEAVKPPPITDNTYFHVGVSGGKDSAAALLWMVRESGIDPCKILSSFCDIGNDHEWTIAHVELLSKKVHPIETIWPELDFFALAMKKHRFPAPKSRFCTEHLKIIPTQEHIQYLRLHGMKIIAVSGVRGDESDDRSKLPEWDFNGYLMCPSWRPLIRWTLTDVMAIHERHAVPLNPLYALGAQRVGCWPCIMSRKSEIRMIALKFPERITVIREQELLHEKTHGRFSGFFKIGSIPDRFCSRHHTCKDGRVVMVPTIDDVVKWSMTGDRAQGSWDDEPEKETISCTSGFCE